MKLPYVMMESESRTHLDNCIVRFTGNLLGKPDVIVSGGEVSTIDCSLFRWNNGTTYCCQLTATRSVIMNGMETEVKEEEVVVWKI